MQLAYAYHETEIAQKDYFVNMKKNFKILEEIKVF